MKKRVKVLHIWNTAGVASTLAKYQAKVLGWKTWVITRKKYDPFGFTTYGEASDSPLYIFAAKVFLSVPRYDIVHVHSWDSVVPLLKRLFPKKKVILHYHGTDIRGRWGEKERFWKKADIILVSTPDLLENSPRSAIYLPNPVDTDLFKPLPHVNREPGTALFIYYDIPGVEESIKWAREVAEKMGLKLTLHNRASNPIPYTRLPEFLNKYEYFIDRRWVKSLSKTALEALACGLKVVRWDDKVVDGLPQDHRPENVVKRLAEIYGDPMF